MNRLCIGIPSSLKREAWSMGLVERDTNYVKYEHTLHSTQLRLTFHIQLYYVIQFTYSACNNYIWTIPNRDNYERYTITIYNYSLRVAIQLILGQIFYFIENNT